MMYVPPKQKLLIVLGLGAFAILFHARFDPSYFAGSPFQMLDSESWDEALFENTPFCDANGKCGERSDKPSPRTYYSSRKKIDYKNWNEMHGILRGSAMKYEGRRHSARRDARRSGSSVDRLLPPLVLLGDSIVESWLGTSGGQLADRATGVPFLVHRIFEPHYDPLVLGISGDQTQHLLYRMMDGEIHSEYGSDKEAVFVVSIGTNNLSSGVLPKNAAMGVKAVVEYLLKHTKGKVLLMKVLPRGDVEKIYPLCRPRCDANGGPLKSFLPWIDEMNTLIEKKVVPRLKSKFGKKRLSLMDCGKQFLGSEDGSVRETKDSLMPDGLHPNVDGYEILSQCILDCAAGRCE